MSDQTMEESVASRRLELALSTINAPLPQPIAPDMLVRCINSGVVAPQWRVHVASFFNDVSIEVIHDLVLAGVFEFTSLERAARLWGATDGRSFPWIREMAELSLGRPAA